MAEVPERVRLSTDATFPNRLPPVFAISKFALTSCFTSTSSVLVVEDQEEQRHDVRTLLESDGYVVHEAATLDEAVTLLSGIPRPCIVLWDTVMPRHDLSLVDEAAFVGVKVAILP